MKGEEVYAQALLEIRECRMLPALWARAQATAQGDGNAAISHYILYRVQQGAGIGPESQIMLHGSVHSPCHGVRCLGGAASTEGANRPPPAFLRIPGRALSKRAQAPVWGNPAEGEAVLYLRHPNATPHHALPHSPAGSRHPISAAWRRFLIRVADLSLASAVLFGLLVLLTPEKNFLPGLFADLLDVRLEDSGAGSLFAWCSDAALLFVLLPGALGIDALVHAVFGSTPGRALYGVKLRTRQGILSPRAYLLRNYQVWLNGFGLGLLPVAMVTMAWQFVRVARGQGTSYDHAESLTIQFEDASHWRVVAIYLLAAFGLSISLGLSGLLFDLW